MINSVQYPITIKIIYEDEAVDAPYVAYIPEFDVSSCGKTEVEAVKNVHEALNIVIDEVKNEGKFENFMDELGLLKKAKSPGAMFPKIIFEPYYLPAI